VTMTSKQFIRMLEKDGWTKERGKGKGSHVTLVKEGKEIVVPFHNRDLKPGTLHRLLKKAGLK